MNELLAKDLDKTLTLSEKVARLELNSKNVLNQLEVVKKYIKSATANSDPINKEIELNVANNFLEVAMEDLKKVERGI
ncbi:MAG: hypothetical protein N4A57_02570 [Anaeromicrobium sp.]|uniref:hypothetical protein n=1 Tax=Anaeromicrobium sp. TaxID=1929132 RepID=UPI0025F19750|nr:hypothetical protein [Anaeromicrobium sp.]MCT4593144.1 hypothetical protein [Anaeromicrobium sp.]